MAARLTYPTAEKIDGVAATAAQMATTRALRSVGIQIAAATPKRASGRATQLIDLVRKPGTVGRNVW